MKTLAILMAYGLIRDIILEHVPTSSEDPSVVNDFVKVRAEVEAARQRSLSVDTTDPLGRV